MLDRRGFILIAGGAAAVAPLIFWGIEDQPVLAQGVMAGEPTQDSVILQTRLAKPVRQHFAMPCEGFVRFEISENSEFIDSRFTDTQAARLEQDGIVKVFVSGLIPGRRYYYRAWFGKDPAALSPGDAGLFRTLKGANKGDCSFCVFSCLGYAQFFGFPVPYDKVYEGDDRNLGYPGLAAIRALELDFVVGTGDTVYYDYRGEKPRATTKAEMRECWSEQAILPRFRECFASVASYWQKDDHDHRFNDCDPYRHFPTSSDPQRSSLPSTRAGSEIFLEQLPLVAEGSARSLYRTHRVSRDLQIWLLEGREYRSSNDRPDGPAKSLWGAEQREWLEHTLKESDARWRIVVSPGPIVGPDYNTKRDNHTNWQGFRYEGNAFLRFLRERGLARNVFLVCGDRHWPYHSVSPEGIHEFSVGTLTEGNGFVPPERSISTDPDGLIEQRWVSSHPLASFLCVEATPLAVTFRLLTSKGTELYSVGFDA